jgi:hypothetical protein
MFTDQIAVISRLSTAITWTIYTTGICTIRIPDI